MSLWTNKDEEAGKPKYLSTAEKTVTFGVSNDEVAATAGVTHGGWVQKTTGSGGRSGRTFYETLVAMGTMTADGTTSATTQDRTITITTQPSNASVADAEEATFTVVASLAPTGSATISYQWQVDTGSGFGDISGATSASYTFEAATADNGNSYQCVVSADGAADVTSDAATLTVA